MKYQHQVGFDEGPKLCLYATCRTGERQSILGHYAKFNSSYVLLFIHLGLCHVPFTNCLTVYALLFGLSNQRCFSWKSVIQTFRVHFRLYCPEKCTFIVGIVHMFTVLYIFIG